MLFFCFAMTEPFDNDKPDDKNNPYIVGGESEEELRLKSTNWYWESQPKKIREHHEKKKRELRVASQVSVALKCNLGHECAKRYPDEAVVKQGRREVQKQEAEVRRLKKEVRKAKDEVLKCDDKFDWEEYLEKPIGIGDLVIIKTGRYVGEVGEVQSRTKKFRYKIKLITMENEIVYRKATNLEKTDDV